MDFTSEVEKSNLIGKGGKEETVLEESLHLPAVNKTCG